MHRQRLYFIDGIAKLAATADQLLASVRPFHRVRIRPDYITDPFAAKSGLEAMKTLLAIAPALSMPNPNSSPQAAFVMYKHSPELAKLFPSGGIAMPKGGIAPWIKRVHPRVHREIMAMPKTDRGSIWKALNAILQRHEADEALVGKLYGMAGPNFHGHAHPEVLLREGRHLGDLTGLSKPAKGKLFDVWERMFRSGMDSFTLKRLTGRDMFQKPRGITNAVRDQLNRTYGYWNRYQYVMKKPNPRAFILRDILTLRSRGKSNDLIRRIINRRAGLG